MILIMGRYEYDIEWLNKLLFPYWILNLHLFDILVPDWEAAYQDYRNFNFYNWWNSEKSSIFSWMADDLTEYLIA